MYRFSRAKREVSDLAQLPPDVRNKYFKLCFFESKKRFFRPFLKQIAAERAFYAGREV